MKKVAKATLVPACAGPYHRGVSAVVTHSLFGLRRISDPVRPPRTGLWVANSSTHRTETEYRLGQDFGRHPYPASISSIRSDVSRFSRGTIDNLPPYQFARDRPAGGRAASEGCNSGDFRVRKSSILGGLHHEYRLEKLLHERTKFFASTVTQAGAAMLTTVFLELIPPNRCMASRSVQAARQSCP
jgi:hypothetical protein